MKITTTALSLSIAFQVSKSNGCRLYAIFLYFSGKQYLRMYCKQKPDMIKIRIPDTLPVFKSYLLIIPLMCALACRNTSTQKTATKTPAESSIPDRIRSAEKAVEVPKARPQPDTIRNMETTRMTEAAFQKATVSLRDSLLRVYGNIRADYRIFGYEQPDTNSRKLIFFSVFTTDVEKNPYQCPYGAYYATSDMPHTTIKYISNAGNFIKANLIQAEKVETSLYIRKEWVEFEKQ